MRTRAAGRLGRLRCCIAVYGCARTRWTPGDGVQAHTAGYELTGGPGEATWSSSTCGFIEDAKKESIEGIFQQ